MQNKLSLLGLVVAVALLPSVGLAQQPVRWETSLENAQRLAAQSNRLVLIYFWGSSCVACKRMEAETLTQPSVAAELAANYVPVKLNADNFQATAKQYNLTHLPTTVITTPQGQLVDSMRGRVEAPEYCARLNKVAADVKQRGAAVYAQMPTANAPPTVAAASQTPPASIQPQPAPATGPALSGDTPPLASNAQAAGSNRNTADDRYADFFRRSQAAPAIPIAQPPSNSPEPINTQPPTSYAPAAQTAVPPAGAPTAGVAQGYPPASAGPPAFQGQTPAPAIAAVPYGSQMPPLSVQQPSNPMPAGPLSPSSVGAAASQAPTMSPTLCLDGYCPVTLAEKQQWVVGDQRWGAIHRGRTYLFIGPEEQRRFFTDPDRYAPAISGNDVVMATDQGQTVLGMREHGVFFGNRVYLFSGEATLEKFAKNPSQYASQALGASRSSNYAGQPLK